MRGRRPFTEVFLPWSVEHCMRSKQVQYMVPRRNVFIRIWHLMSCYIICVDLRSMLQINSHIFCFQRDETRRKHCCTTCVQFLRTVNGFFCRSSHLPYFPRVPPEVAKPFNSFYTHVYSSMFLLFHVPDSCFWSICRGLRFIFCTRLTVLLHVTDKKAFRL